jgi:hypothetical protein
VSYEARMVRILTPCRAELQIHCLVHRVELRNAKEGWSHG